MVAIKTLLWSIFVPTTVTIIIPYFTLSTRLNLLRLHPSKLRFFGILPIVIGVAIYARSAWDFTFVGKGTPAPFDPPKQLVVTGPYRYLRNPIYTFVVLVLLGEAIFFESTALLVYAALVFSFLHLWLVRYEEAGLKRRFGKSYETYCETVSRWIPKRTKPSNAMTRFSTCLV